MSSIYLSNEIFDYPNVNVDPQTDWRATAVNHLHRHGLKVVNPLEIPAVSELEDESLSNRVRRALELIDRSDAVLANLHKPSYGTAMEIFYAHRKGKMVTVIGQSPFSPWVVSHSTARFNLLEQGLEYLMQELLQTDNLNWALQFENLLADRSENYPPSGEADYQFVGGELPVLVLAPRATSYFRDGEYCEAEPYTGAMAATIGKMAQCHVLSSNYCQAADPLHYLETPISRALCDIVRAGQIGIVVMILGSSTKERGGVEIKSSGLSDELLAELRLRFLPVEQVQYSETEPEDDVLFNLCSKSLSVPVLAIRTHRRFRMPRLQPQTFTQVVEILADFCFDIGTDLLRKNAG